MGELAQLRRSTGAALCLECGKCSTLCPLAPFGEFSAARMMSIHDPQTEIFTHAETVERCLTCASCEVRCPQGVRYTEFVRGLRRELAPECRRPRPHGEVFQIAAKLREEIEGARRAPWLDDGLRFAEEGEVALFVGCLPLFDVVFGRELEVEMVDIARSAIRLLNRLDIEPVLVADEGCCGHDLYWTGDQEAFEKVARRNAALFEARGVRHILTVCAECCRTWKVEYRQIAGRYQPQVEHLAEFLAARLEGQELQLAASENGAVTYQDPCRLGRQLGVLEAPRQLLRAASGTDVLEMSLSGRDALCCGTAGFIHCDSVSRQLQAQRLASAAATGASKLVTACPKCLLHFRCAQSEDRRRGRPGAAIEVQDLTVYLASSLAEMAEAASSQQQDPSQTGDKA